MIDSSHVTPLHVEAKEIAEAHGPEAYRQFCDALDVPPADRCDDNRRWLERGWMLGYKFLADNASPEWEAELVRKWIADNLRPALRDPEFMKRHLALLKVGKEAGDDPAEILSRFVASVVLDAAGVEIEPEEEADD
mgnify:CR=1 FL=1